MQGNDEFEREFRTPWLWGFWALIVMFVASVLAQFGWF